MATIDRRDTRGGQPRNASELLDRVPPQNLDAERGVLGSVLLDPEVLDDVALVIREEDFYLPAHQALFQQLLAMHAEGKQIDVTLLTDRLQRAGLLDSIGGVPYLVEVVEAVPTAANAGYYAEIVRDRATLRAMIHAGTEIVRDAFDQSLEARDLLSRAEERVLSILDRRGGAETSPLSKVLSDAMDRIDRRKQRGGQIGGVSTGFVELDTVIDGLHESELIIIAARPSMGKTAFATNIAEHIALQEQLPALFFSLEMSRLELADRLLCSRARVNGQRLRKGTVSQADMKKLIDAAGELSRAPLYIDDTPSRTITEIGAVARRLKKRHGLGLIVIDYLQLIEPDNPKDPRQEQVAKIARRLKALARELKVPLLCLAQLNRQADMGKEGHRPRLSHLRESGAIEQDADVVMFVHREEYYAQKEEDKKRLAGQAEIMVAKQRNGPVDDVKLAWLSDYTRFENLAAHAFSDEYNFDQLT